MLNAAAQRSHSPDADHLCISLGNCIHSGAAGLLACVNYRVPSNSGSEVLRIDRKRSCVTVNVEIYVAPLCFVELNELSND